ncbi:MAG: metallophosphoesterase family protein [Patescibacteria group bacterium]|nr:metallophosphoesterase family protein [Patescibacteria group bacterium]
MKTLIFSDTHLGPLPSKRKLDFLINLIEDYDQVIINGDFWEWPRYSFNRFVNSSWSKLFPLLKKRKTYYIYGNHDPAKQSDERVSLFCDEHASKLDLKIGKKRFHFEHGHEIVPSFNKLNFLPEKRILPAVGGGLMDCFEGLGVTLIGPSFSKININRRIENKYAIKKLAKRGMDNKINILGHTHRPYLDPCSFYINTGCIKFGYATYVRIENDKISIGKERY